VMLRRHAQRDAEEMAAALNAELGGGWEPYVWENLGWHYCARRTNGLDWPDPEARCVTVYPSTYSDKTTYRALVSNDAGPGMPIYYSAPRGETHFDSPAEAVRKLLPQVEAHVAKVQKTLEHLRAALGRVVVPGTPPALVAERLPNEPTPPRDCQ
jgi:hypothetical protein